MGLAALVMVLTLGLADLSAFLLARAKAQTAADAAALAAAAELLPGPHGGKPGPEASARKLASANGAELLTCSCEPRSDAAIVYVAVPVRFAILRAIGAGEVVGRARAEVDIPGRRDRRTR